MSLNSKVLIEVTPESLAQSYASIAHKTAGLSLDSLHTLLKDDDFMEPYRVAACVFLKNYELRKST